MAQIQSKLQKTAEKKPAVKADTRGTRKRTRWSTISKKFLLPASILMILGGVLLTAYNVLQIANPAETYTVSTGLKITSVVLGLLMIVCGVLALLKQQKGRTLMTLGALTLVYAIIVLTATATMGAMAIVNGVVAIVLGLFYVVAVDGMYDTGLIRFFREMFGEVKKLSWLSGRELVSYTAAVIAFVLAMALIIYLLDLAFSSGFGALSNIKIG